MEYIICISGFHKEMAHKINGITESKEVKLCFFPKKSKGVLRLKNIAKFIRVVLTCTFDKNSHVIVPHVFNPYFSVLLKVSKRHSFYDDGIAYYYESKAPSNFLCQAYVMLAKKSNPQFRIKDLGSRSYFDYLAGSNAVNFYCIFPDLVSETRPNKIRVSLDRAECHREEGDVVYLDTTSDVANKLCMQKVLEELKQAAALNNGVIYFKEHPAGGSSISSALKIMTWAKELDINYEEYLRSKGVKRMYSVYSSAIFSTHLIYPNAELFCFTNREIEQPLKGIKGILHEAGVKFLQA